VRGWAAWEWLTYMQKRNPSTPAIASKLFITTHLANHLSTCGV
jgi:hypothetical protein